MEATCPCASFEEAFHVISSSNETFTILVSPGVYTGPNNVDLLVPRSVSIVAEEGPVETIIQCEEGESSFLIDGEDAPYTLLSGLSTQNCQMSIWSTLPSLSGKEDRRFIPY